MTGPARFRPWLEHLLHSHDTPERTAAAYALGVFVGFSPFLGLHTVLGLSAAFALGLNRVAVLLGLFTNLPWIMAPYYTLATLLGAALLRYDLPPGLLASLREALARHSWSELRHLIRSLTPLLWAYTLGSLLGAVTLAGLSYRLALATIVRHRRRSAARVRPEHTDL